jgi:hypothetical protein
MTDPICDAARRFVGLGFDTLRRTRTRSDGTTVEVPAIDALFQAVEHLRGHADDASLTRLLWNG